MTQGLHLHHGLVGEQALDALATAVEAAVVDPFDLIPLAVPDPGTSRWASQGLATRLGVSAGIAPTSVRSILTELVAQITGIESNQDPWRVGSLQWTILSLLDDERHEPWARVVTAHLPADDGSGLPGRRFQAAHRIARLLLRTERRSPEVMRQWEVGDDVDFEGSELGPDRAWEPELWRRLVDRIEVPCLSARYEMAAEMLETAPVAPFVVVDPPLLDEMDASLMEAVAQRVSGTVLTLSGQLDPHSTLVRRLGATTAAAVSQWMVIAPHHTIHSTGSDPTSALGVLQAEARGAATPVMPMDDSVWWHESHGPDRQVEVLRDALLHAFQEDPTLEPRDVVVFCPDVATFAPHLGAAFSLPAQSDEEDAHGHELRVTIADPALRQANPIYAVLMAALDLNSSRAEASTLLDLCAMPPVAERFGFREQDLERLTELVERSGVRWGINAQHRARFGLDTVTQGTWMTGLDRMMVGIALSDDRLDALQMALPLDDVGSNDVEVIGRLAELVARLTVLLTACATPRPAREWAALLSQAVDDLTAASGEQAWQTTHAHAVLADIADDAPVDGPPMGLADARSLLADALRGRPPRVGHRTGSLVVCQPGQLTHVPHRVVALLGFDEHVFPQRSRPDGDDIAHDAVDAEITSLESLDRARLLASVMAARERLIVVHRGRDPRSNEDTPPPSALAEISDALERATGEPDHQWKRRHPLQPFAADNFDPEGPLGSRVSFDPVNLAAARALAQPAIPAPQRFALAPLPPLPLETVTLEELSRFLQHPVKTFLETRAGLRFYEPDAIDDALPIELDGLAEWKIGARMLQRALAGADLSDVERAEWLRGEIPPKVWGGRVIARVRARVEAALAAAAPLLEPVPITHDIALDLDGVQVRGRVVTRGDFIVDVGYGKPGPKHALAGWVQMLAVTAATGHAYSWTRVGRGRLTLHALPPTWNARAGLGVLVDLYSRGLCEPLPLPPKTGHAWVMAAQRYQADLGESEQRRRVLENYEASHRDSFDERDEAWKTFYPTAQALVRPRSVKGEGAPNEQTRLGALATQLWGPIVQRWEETR